jgi:hypothetical protein
VRPLLVRLEALRGTIDVFLGRQGLGRPLLFLLGALRGDS